MGITAEEAARLSESCFARTAGILNDHPDRTAGSDGCRAAAARLAAGLRSCCDAVAEEPFTVHARVLWWTGRIVAGAYAAGFGCALLGGAWLWAGLAVTCVALCYAVAHYVVCAELFDAIFPASEGRNVVGTIEPDGRVEQQVLLVGHHDSPFVLSFLTWLPQLAFPRLLLGVLFFLFLVAVLAAAAVRQATLGLTAGLSDGLAWVLAIGLLFVIPLFFLNTNRRSPGAGDNLNSSSMAVSVAAHFFQRRANGAPLSRTRLIVLSTDGEEVGQRGAIAYVRAHLDELRSLPTRVLNVDSVYRLEDLSVCTRDRNCTTALSHDMARELQATARRRGYRLPARAIPFCGGGTDAAAFSVAGISATSVIGLPTGLFERSACYHTEKDTLERIDARAVQAVIEIAVDYVDGLDRDGLRPVAGASSVRSCARLERAGIMHGDE